ncbi:MAG: Zn-dependent hydrolase [Lentimicrobiaceae bacterium]|nr:Zn-dependent hydrolase [Lentimicrobiaceae bacterium]
MKKHRISLFTMALASVFAVGCGSNNQQKEQEENTAMKEKVAEFALVDLTTDLSLIGENEKQLLPIFIQIAEIMDELFWRQTFGDRSILDTISDVWTKEFAKINYGPWERLNDNIPFVSGYGEKPTGCQYYPVDMTEEEFDALENPDKNSLYTVLRRGNDGKLKVVWYKEQYKEQLAKVCELMQKAVDIAEDEGLKNYLTLRKKAFETDDYFPSDMAWMDMKNSLIDFVVGPIENYDDKYERKASYEAFVLVKDVEWSNDLAKFTAMLPDLQKELPCEPKYKEYVPGTSSDLNVYDAVYYAGDCNSGSKTIAINLPNDDKVQALKGSRRLQLKNAMRAKFDKILMPIGELIIEKEQQKHLKFDAFFWNVTFHEVTHGLGVKQTINGKGSVDDAMKDEKTSWEEAKADILGLFMVNYLIEKGEITNITQEDAITTYIAGILRSVRFGAASSHGKANMMCFNFMEDKQAFTRNQDGTYHVDFEKAKTAVNEWAALILKTQAEGDYAFAKSFREENGGIRESLQKDLDLINSKGIPKDIRFNQGRKTLGLE